MKCIVIYDSHSGSTKKIAEAIHAGMSSTGEPSEIARIRNANPRELSGYDLIGLGSPVIGGQEMHNVTSFIENMKGVDGKHGFAFCTHGALPARYLARVVTAMTQRGLTMVGWNDWFGAVFYPAVPKPYFTDGHPDDIDLKEAEDFGRGLVELSRRIYQGETGLIPEFPRGKNYDEIYSPGTNTFPPIEVLKEYHKTKARVWRDLKVNKDKCLYPKCTVCMDNCPNHSIDFSVDPPLFNIRCEVCFMCAQICPRGAIEVDWESLNEVHLPMVPPLQRSLEEFEAMGKFRRLVPLDEVGWNSFVYKKNPPRFKPA
jgi:flavodoxin/ferredoxin